MLVFAVGVEEKVAAGAANVGIEDEIVGCVEFGKLLTDAGGRRTITVVLVSALEVEVELVVLVVGNEIPFEGELRAEAKECSVVQASASFHVTL